MQNTNHLNSNVSQVVDPTRRAVDGSAMKNQPLARPLFAHAVCAGFPSPADDYIEEHISLDAYLIARPEATFFLRVAGHSMQGMGIHDGDLLVIDRSVTAISGHVVIAVMNGELTVKQFHRTANGCVLRAAHVDYPDILVDAEQELHIWGVVRWAIHKIDA